MPVLVFVCCVNFFLNGCHLIYLNVFCPCVFACLHWFVFDTFFARANVVLLVLVSKNWIKGNNAPTVGSPVVYKTRIGQATSWGSVL